MLCVLSSWALAAPLNFANETYATALKNVRTGSLNGKDFLTIEIDRGVGPMTCFGNTLRIDSGTAEGGLERQQELENIALAAVITNETVIVTVPTAVDQCVDGMPMIADIEPLPTYP